MLTAITSNPKALRTTTAFATAIFTAAILLFGAGHDTVHAGINAHSRSFDLSIAQYSPRGVWSDGTTIWVANSLGRNSKLWAYRQATGARTYDKDISLTDGNNKPMGIWSDGSIMWVVDWDDDKLYAYDLDTGARQSDRDISLNRYNTTPRGVGGTPHVIYVVDKDDKHVYAYNLSDGSRFVSAEFDLHGSNDSPWGFTASSSQDVFWVTDLADEMLYRYYYTGLGSTRGGQDFRVPLGNGDPMGLWGDGEVFWMVDGEDDRVYSMIHKDFRHSGDDITINDMTDPRGIWTDGETMWVAYSTASNGTMLAYNLSTGSRDSAREFTLADTNESPVAMWSDGTHIWVAEEDGRTLYAYSLDNSGAYSVIHSRVLTNDNADPSGFWSNDDLTWVADATDDKIYAYDASTFFRHSNRDIDLATENGDPGNIWSDGNTMWVFDTADKNAYAYSLRNGNRKRSEEFRPVPDNADLSGGMTGHGLRFWVVDTDDQKLYAYAKQNTPASFSERSARFKIHHSLAGDSLIGSAPAATDVDNDPLTYAIKGTDSQRFTIDSQSGEIKSKSDATFTAGEQLSFVATVRDNKGLLDGADRTADDSVNVFVNVIHNANPTFVTEDGTTFTVAEDIAAGDAIAQLDTTDLDNHGLVIGIRRSARFPFTVVAGQIELKSDETLDFETVASYDFTVRVRDDLNEANEADTEWDDEIAITIQVSNVEEAGTVTLGSNNPQVNVSLTASLTDPDGSVADLTWQWQTAATADAATWTDISGATASSYTPVSGDVGKYIRALASYDDGQGMDKTASGVASNSVLADTPTNQSPSFTEGATTSRSIAENAESGARVGAPIVATDPDTDDTLTYRMLSEGSNPFRMDFYTGQIYRTAQTFLSYESGASYIMNVLVRDGKDADGEDDVAWDAFIDVTINVLDVDEPGTVALTEENPQVGQQISAELDDPDIPVTNVSWQWQTADTADATTWTGVTDATTGDYTPTLADHGKFLRVQATYDDKHGTGKTVHVVSTNAVPPRPANQPPEFDEGATATRSVSEAAVTGALVGAAVLASDAESDELTYSLATGADAGLFAIDPDTGKIEVATGALLDFETKPSLSLTAQVSDGMDVDHNADSAVDDTITVTINLINADEPGSVSFSITQPSEGNEITASLTDPDGAATSVAWQWSKSADGEDNWEDIASATAASYTPVAADVGFYLRATARYTDPQGSGKQSSRIINTPVAGLVNEPPRLFGGATTERQVAEDASPGAAVGAPVVALDPESDPLAYTLASEGDADRFAIGSTTGQLTLASGVTLDYETDHDYQVVVQVTDGKDGHDNPDTGIDDTIAVTIRVLNVDEPGVVELSSMNPEVGKEVAASLTDPDGGVASPKWRWEKSQNGSSNWEAINGSTTDSYTPQPGDAGTYLRAMVDYTDDHGPGKHANRMATERVPANDGGSRGSAPQRASFYDQCRSDLLAGLAANCAKNPFAVSRVELDGRYTIDWSDWDAANPGVTGYTIMLDESVYKTYYQDGVRVEDTVLANVYESCAFAENRWMCEGQLKANYREDMNGLPTRSTVVGVNLDETRWTSSLQAPGQWMSDRSYHQWSGDATDPSNEPTTVNYTVKAFEMDLYLFIAHGGDGGGEFALVDGANGFDERR